MKIAITGANGFVGSNLLRYYQDLGHETVAIIRNTATLPATGAIIREVDYSSIDSIKAALSDVDVLIHNAGKTKALNHEDMLAANVGITQRVVAAVNASEHPIHLILISTQAASRPSVHGIPVQESDPPAPVTIYGKSKQRAEKLVQNRCIKPWTIIRPCSVYGAGDRDFLELFKLIKLGLVVQIGHEPREINMIHVRQLAEFIALTMQNPAACSQIFFASDTSVYTQAEIASIIAEVMDLQVQPLVLPEAVAILAFHAADLYGRITHREMPVNREKLKEILAPGWVSSPTKAKQLLGWNPQTSIKDLIQETYQWYIDSGWL